MTTYRYKTIEQADKDFIERVERINITDYVKTFVLSYNKKHNIKLKTNYSTGVEYLKTLLNSSQERVCPYLEQLNGFFYWNTQKVDFVPSNLHKGYLFYFVCSYCERRVKYLYRYKTYNEPSCRTCCDLEYISPNRKTRSLSRLARKPYLSSEDRFWIIKHAGITKEDFL